MLLLATRALGFAGLRGPASVPASFDCSMRKAAYAFGRSLLPRIGDGFASLYYALNLNDPACSVPLARTNSSGAGVPLGRPAAPTAHTRSACAGRRALPHSATVNPPAATRQRAAARLGYLARAARRWRGCIQWAPAQLQPAWRCVPRQMLQNGHLEGVRSLAQRIDAHRPEQEMAAMCVAESCESSRPDSFYEIMQPCVSVDG